MKKYKLVVAGGTFDNLHKGHEKFLDFLLSLSDEVLLGITSDEFVKSKRPMILQSYAARKKAVLDNLLVKNATKRVTIAEIDTIHPPIAWQKMPIEAIVVTEDTKSGADAINTKRAEIKLPQLPIEIMSLEHAEDGTPISSRRIRRGEIRKDGKLFLSSSDLKKNYLLPEGLRDNLKSPFGELIIDNKFAYSYLVMENVVTVGDIATKTFLERNLTPRIAIIDFIVERKHTFATHKDIGYSGNELVLKAENPSGQITASLMQAIVEAFSLHPTKHVVITVAGEEDLAVIPCILKAPLGTLIFYGQPGIGLVKVDVTYEQKEAMYALFHKLKIKEN